MSDPIFNFGSEEAKKALAEGANTFVIPEGKYHLQVIRSAIELNKNKDGNNWVMDFGVLEPDFPNTKLRHWHVLKVSNLWKTIPALEAIFQEPWTERELMPEDVKSAYGLKCIGIVTVEPHYDASKAAQGTLINKISDFLPDDGMYSESDVTAISSPGEVGHPDYKPM